MGKLQTRSDYYNLSQSQYLPSWATVSSKPLQNIQNTFIIAGSTTLTAIYLYAGYAGGGTDPNVYHCTGSQPTVYLTSNGKVAGSMWFITSANGLKININGQGTLYYPGGSTSSGTLTYTTSQVFAIIGYTGSYWVLCGMPPR